MAVLEIQANGDTPVSKEAIANAGQSLEDPLMRVSLKISSCNHGNVRDGCPKQFFFNTGPHMPPSFIPVKIQTPCRAVSILMPGIKSEHCKLGHNVHFCNYVLHSVSSCRSSPSLVCVTKQSSVLQLTTFCSTESCSRFTPSNCLPPTASSTTSVSFSPPPPSILQKSLLL